MPETVRTPMVRRSLTQTKPGVEAKETKTGRARAVMVPDSLITGLYAHRKEQELRKSILGDEYVEEGWILRRSSRRTIMAQMACESVQPNGRATSPLAPP